MYILNKKYGIIKLSGSGLLISLLMLLIIISIVTIVKVSIPLKYLIIGTTFTLLNSIYWKYSTTVSSLYNKQQINKFLENLSKNELSKKFSDQLNLQFNSTSLFLTTKKKARIEVLLFILETYFSCQLVSNFSFEFGKEIHITKIPSSKYYEKIGIDLRRIQMIEVLNKAFFTHYYSPHNPNIAIKLYDFALEVNSFKKLMEDNKPLQLLYVNLLSPLISGTVYPYRSVINAINELTNNNKNESKRNYYNIEEIVKFIELYKNRFGHSNMVDLCRLFLLEKIKKIEYDYGKVLYKRIHSINTNASNPIIDFLFRLHNNENVEPQETVCYFKNWNEKYPSLIHIMAIKSISNAILDNSPEDFLRHYENLIVYISNSTYKQFFQIFGMIYDYLSGELDESSVWHLFNFWKKVYENSNENDPLSICQLHNLKIICILLKLPIILKHIMNMPKFNEYNRHLVRPNVLRASFDSFTHNNLDFGVVPFHYQFPSKMTKKYYLDLMFNNDIITRTNNR